MSEDEAQSWLDAAFGPDDGDDGRGELTGRLLLGVALLAALLIRCLPWRNFANPNGGFYFYSIDAYDHLRRITLGVARFPSLADFDYYAAFPRGLGQLWAPGFDYLLTAIALLAGGSKEAIETVCFFFNPVVAAVTVLVVFFIARALFRSQIAGTVAAVLLALHPAFTSSTLPMNFDHHSVEPLIALLLFALPLLERRGRLSCPAMCAAAAALLLAIVLWRGSTLYWGLAFVSILSQVVLANNRRLALSYGVVFGAVGLVLGIYCGLDPWGGARQLAFGVISLFHVLLLVAWAAILFLFWLCRSRRLFFWWFGGALLLALLAILAGPLADMVKQLAGGLSFIRGQGDPWLESNSELRGVFKERYSFWYSASYLTPFWFLAPLAVWLGFRQWSRGGRQDALLLNFMVWSPVLAMGFIIRYSPIAGLFTSLAGGFLVAKTWNACRGGRWQWLVLVGCIVLLLPGVPHVKDSMAVDLPGDLKYGLYGEQGLLEWLKQKTPPTSYWLDPTKKPEYGVLARWSMGARIYQLAERPALATAFGWEAYGFFQEAGFWVTEDEAKALAIAREGQVRYVVAQANHDLKTDFDEVLQGQARGDLPAATANPVLRPERSMQVRLMQGDGSIMKAGEVMLPALESFRLVYESPYLANRGGGADLSSYKVFEIVKGAVITGKVSGGAKVTLMLEMQTSRGRKMTYLSQTVADENGLFAVRVPYATTVQQGDSVPLAAGYIIYVGREVKATVVISEADVVNGATVRFD